MLGRNTMRPPEALLPRNPTMESSHFSGLTIGATQTMTLCLVVYLVVCLVGASKKAPRAVCQ